MSDKSFVDEIQSHSELVTGKKASIDDAADNFALYGATKRIDILKDFDERFNKSEIDLNDVEGTRKYLRDKELRKRMGEIHERLRKAKR